MNKIILVIKCAALRQALTTDFQQVAGAKPTMIDHECDKRIPAWLTEKMQGKFRPDWLDEAPPFDPLFLEADYRQN